MRCCLGAESPETTDYEDFFFFFLWVDSHCVPGATLSLNEWLFVFSEKDKRSCPPPPHSDVLTQGRAGSCTVWRVDDRGGPQDSPCETCLSTQESEAAQQLASPQPISPFFWRGERKWHVWVTHLLQGAASAGMLCCRATMQFCNSLYCIMVFFVFLQITIMGLHLLKPLDSSSPQVVSHI